MSYWYLATPYALYPEGKQAAYEAAKEQTAYLLSKGIPVYSPIVHNHPISLLDSLKDKDGDFDFWIKLVDVPLMQGASGLLVCCLESWERSKGIVFEIDWFNQNNKPIKMFWPFGDILNLPPLVNVSNSLHEVQKELVAWQQHNFPGRPAWQPLVGMQEELGELSHAFLKKSQNIRLNEDHDANMKDALADLLVYACDFANAVGVDLSLELNNTWSKVKQRDWQKHREDPKTNDIPSDKVYKPTGTDSDFGRRRYDRDGRLLCLWCNEVATREVDGCPVCEDY